MASIHQQPIYSRPRTRATVRQLTTLDPTTDWLSWANQPIPSAARSRYIPRSPSYSPPTPPFVFAPGTIFTDDEEIPPLDIGPKLTPLYHTSTHITKKERKRGKEAEVVHWSWEDLAAEERRGEEEKRKRRLRLRRRKAWGGLSRRMTKKRKSKKAVVAVVNQEAEQEMEQEVKEYYEEEDLYYA